MPIYMKYGDIKGGATAAGHAGEIDLLSCQLGPSRPAKDSNKKNDPAEGSSISEVTVTKYQDVASTALFREALEGTGKNVKIDFLTKNNAPGTAPYLSVALDSAMISSYSISGHGGDGSKMESFTINYEKISYTSTPTQSPDPGAAPDKMGWDVALDQTGG